MHASDDYSIANFPPNRSPYPGRRCTAPSSAARPPRHGDAMHAHQPDKPYPPGFRRVLLRSLVSCTDDHAHQFRLMLGIEDTHLGMSEHRPLASQCDAAQLP
jgi:hypothetical protein